MAIKELQTRIQLKYDSYANWKDLSKEGQGGNLVLLKGEIGICEIPGANTHANESVVPTVLFKVGDGTKTFDQLPWASAKAADVYKWAKAATVVVETVENKEVLRFKDADGNVIAGTDVDLSRFALASGVADLETRLAELEAAVGVDSDVEGSVSKQIEALGERLDIIEGEEDGSIKKAVADATTALEAYADQAEVDAKAGAKEYTDAEVKKVSDSLAEAEAAISELESDISDNATAIADEATAREEADQEILDKIGEVTGTVAEAIADAKKAGTDAADAVTALENGAVATNAQGISDNAAAIADLEDALETEATTREEKDTELDERLTKVEAFFGDADREDGGYEHLNKALDTLVEIQGYLNGDGDAAGDLIGRVAENEKDIKALQDTLAEGGAFEKRIDDIEVAAAEVEGRVDDLEALTGAEGELRTAIKDAKDQADKGVADADAAAKAAKAAQDDVDALELVVGNEETGLAATKAIADQNTADIADLDERVGDAEEAIIAIQELVAGENAADSNAKLREAITALETLTGDEAKGNAALYTSLQELTGIVNDPNTGLAKTKEIADGAASLASDNATRIADIEADYLRQADEFIFNCGSSSTVVHKQS